MLRLVLIKLKILLRTPTRRVNELSFLFFYSFDRKKLLIDLNLFISELILKLIAEL